jgi:hypothetical protein
MASRSLPRLISLQRAAIVTDVPIKDLNASIRIGQLAFIRIGRGKYLDVADLLDWISRNKTMATP